MSFADLFFYRTGFAPLGKLNNTDHRVFFDDEFTDYVFSSLTVSYDNDDINVLVTDNP